MSTLPFATFSNQAVMFAGIIYTLALLSHVLEWVTRRPLRQNRYEPVTVAAGHGGPPQTESTAAPGAGEGATSKSAFFGRLGVALTVIAFGLHLAGVVARGLAADRVPWGNMYEFALVGALAAAAAYLVLVPFYKVSWLGLPVTTLEVVTLMIAALTLYVSPGPLVPALQSYWLVVHVIAAILATGAFTVGALLSAMFLVQRRRETRDPDGAAGAGSRLPGSEVIDEIAFRVHAFGFPVWTFAALIAGPIWAEYAWGRYWGWDPKEIWAFITWVIYAAYLHARATAGWKGAGAAWVAIAGFAALMFNFVGINLWGSGLHSYSGL